MEKLNGRLQKLQKALKTLHYSLNKLKKFPTTHDLDYELIRDSIIKRFEYTLDLFLKTLKDYLEQVHGLEVPATPKAVIKFCLDAQFLSKPDHDLCIAMINDRNLTSHAYNQDIAEEISTHAYDYYELMNKIANRLAEINTNR